MTIKLLQLNIEKGRFLDRVISYVKEKEFDIVTFQEVTGGRLSKDGSMNCFKILSERLPLSGEMNVNFRIKNQPNSYFGNATFFKNSLSLIKTHELFMKPYEEYKEDVLFVKPPDWTFIPRSTLSLTFKFGKTDLEVLNTHMAWTREPSDNAEKLRQAKILFDYVKKIRNPFILAGDFNLTPDTQAVSMFSQLANNLTLKNKVTNTLNPRTHYVPKLFPKGLAVDYILISNGFSGNKFNLVDQIDLSDHFGLELEFEI